MQETDNSEKLPQIRTMSTLPPTPSAQLQSMSNNPFKMANDDSFFRVREEEKKMKSLTKDKKKTRVWETTGKNVFSRMERLRDIVGEDKVVTLNDALKQDDLVMPRRHEKENISDFIAKKREMFLVQMSLDTKREEIRKLEEKAQMKEEALQQSEQMLEEDAMRFDAFLKENDKKAHDAIKRGEDETKKKQEKIHEIKKLSQQIQALSSEMSKHREALEDCLRYKNFLDMLTPMEWFEKHKKNHADMIQSLRVDSHQKKYKAWEEVKRGLIERYQKEAAELREARKKMKRRDSVDDEELDVKLVIPTAPKLDDEDTPEIPFEMPMYFTEPQQLMDIFSALEEQNLFLIQNSQETERTFEELQHVYHDTKASMDSQTIALQSQIDDLQGQIGSEEGRMKLLYNKRIAGPSTKVSENTANGHGNTKNAGDTNKDSNLPNEQEKERLLADLNNKVSYVYEKCGFDASSKPSTLFMLSQMEIKLEQLLKDIERMPADYVIKAEKEKEKRRRERKREEQQALHIRLQEERNRRAIERSMQAPKKRVGRPVMPRSKPIRSEIRQTGDEKNTNDNSDDKYFT